MNNYIVSLEDPQGGYVFMCHLLQKIIALIWNYTEKEQNMRGQAVPMTEGTLRETVAQFFLFHKIFLTFQK